MPSRDYRIWLSESAYLVVKFVMVKGQIVSFVVRLMVAEADGSESNVARYDTAHGAPHLDVLGKRHGLLSKTWYINVSLEAMLQQAVDDFKRHYEDYICNYVQN